MLRAIAISLPCLLALSACGDDSDPAIGGDTPVDVDTPVADADWYACGPPGVECRELSVPLDYADPDGERIALLLNRSRPSARDEPRGVLLVNPGGPGVSGRPLIEQLAAVRGLGLLSGFELVGFDPRGTGADTPTCVSRAQAGDVYAERGAEGLAVFFADEGRACEEAMGPLFRHVGSHFVVRDMDAIREALGEERLNYLGLSYGTRLGALYAQTFPERTRAMVLDAPVGPVSSLTELIDAQVPALVGAVADFFDACDAGELSCPDQPRDAYDDMARHLSDLGRRDVMGSLWQLLLSVSTGREILADLLVAYAEMPELLDALLDLADEMTSSVWVGTNRSVHCTDETNGPPDLDSVSERLEAFAALAPELMGSAMSLATCAGWPATPDPVPPLTAAGAPPVLIIGGTRDILTPLPMAEALAEALEGSALLVSDHYGHGASLLGEPCVSRAVDDYLTDLTLPEPGARCP
jgi:pimeloyl-ACP methyl ester carboxylesterase